METTEDLQQTGEQFLIFQQEGQILGAVAYVHTNDTLEICRLIVSPGHFRQGIAGRLLEAVEDVEPGIKHLLVSTAEKNFPAISLYQKHGYSITQQIVLPDGLMLVQLHKQVRLEQQ